MLVRDSTVDVTDSGLSSISHVTSSAVNGLLYNVTDTSQDVSVHTSNVEDVTRNAEGISAVTTVAMSYFRDSTSVTSSDGTTDRTSTNDTVVAYASISSSPLVIEIVIPVFVLIIVVVVVVVICLYRKRRRNKDTVRVWQVPGTHCIPIEKQTASWYEDEAGAEVNGGFNPDLELQPYNMADTIICFGNDTDDERPSENKYGAEEMLKDDPDAESDSEISELEEDEAIKEGVILRASVLKKSAQSSVQAGQTSDDVYEFVAPIDDVEKRSENDVKVSDASKENDDDDDYIVMAQAPITDDSEQFQEVSLRHKEEESGDIYANVEIRKVQSMKTAPHSINTPGSHLPKRGASESNMHSHRPPIAQPRVSRKERFDLHDTVPEITNRVEINNTPVNIKSVTTDNYVQNEAQNTDDGSLSDTLESEETANGDSTDYHSDTESCQDDVIYDYPRNNSQVVCEQELEGESLYKVPPSVNT